MLSLKRLLTEIDTNRRAGRADTFALARGQNLAALDLDRHEIGADDLLAALGRLAFGEKG